VGSREGRAGERRRAPAKESGLTPEALRERVAAVRRRIRAAYDRVIADGSIAALG
jgi:hypothetical protein